MLTDYMYFPRTKYNIVITVFNLAAAIYNGVLSVVNDTWYSGILATMSFTVFAVLFCLLVQGGERK